MDLNLTPCILSGENEGLWAMIQIRPLCLSLCVLDTSRTVGTTVEVRTPVLILHNPLRWSL